MKALVVKDDPASRHLVGDGVLRAVANRIGSCVRAYDGVGRFGGEEFLIVFPGGDVEVSTKLADKVESPRLSCASGSFQDSAFT